MLLPLFLYGVGPKNTKVNFPLEIAVSKPLTEILVDAGTLTMNSIFLLPEITPICTSLPELPE